MSTEDRRPDHPVRPNRRAYMADRYRSLSREDLARIDANRSIEPIEPTRRQQPMTDMITQIIRSAAQAGWAAVLSLTVVADAIVALGLDPEWAMGVAMTLTMAVVVYAGRELPKLHPAFGVIINVINKAPAYSAEVPEVG